MNRPVNLFWSESSHYFGANSPVRNFERNVPEESSREELVLERTVPKPFNYGGKDCYMPRDSVGAEDSDSYGYNQGGKD